MKLEATPPYRVPTRVAIIEALREPSVDGRGKMEDLDSRIETLARWMADAERLVVFTGAGISTDSGLPDFRGPDGVWTRKDKGLPPRDANLDWTKTDPKKLSIYLGISFCVILLSFLRSLCLRRQVAGIQPIPAQAGI